MDIGEDTIPEAISVGLDPSDWTALKTLGHRMLDEIFGQIATLETAPVWQAMPEMVRAAWHEPLPHLPTALEQVYADYARLIAPYASGNRHPRFFGWAQGGGTPVGVLAEMLAAGLNANLGGRDHAPIACEQQVIRWSAERLGFPPEASGLLVTGTSMANFIAVLAARVRVLGSNVRTAGVGNARLCAYASAAVHGCVVRALDFAGLGSDCLRLIPTVPAGGLDLAILRDRLRLDRAAGWSPFLVIGTAGSVDTGAIDDLAALADLCAEAQLWFHVDAAYGAALLLSPALKPKLAGIERADSVAFDFHKWLQVPYDAGCVVMRDPAAHRQAFENPAPYLARQPRGLAGGAFWPFDFGPDLSRGFRALKVWMTLKTYGIDRLGAVVEQCCALARYLAERIDGEPRLERVAPVTLNIVCFRLRAGDDAWQAGIAADLQEAGIAAPSTTVIDGRVCLRAAVMNHRTGRADIDALVAGVLGSTGRS